MADASDEPTGGRFTEEQRAFYADAFGTMDPVNGKGKPMRGSCFGHLRKNKASVSAQQFLGLVKVLGVDTTIDMASKLVADCDTTGGGLLHFEEFLELVAENDPAAGLAAFKRSFRDDVQGRIKAIEDREAAQSAHETRIDLAVSAVKAAKLAPATISHLNRKYDELLAHGDPVGVAQIAQGLRDEGDLAHEEATRGAYDLVEAASIDDDRSTVCREAFLRVCAERTAGWHHWWRGDRIVRDDRGFNAGGGTGLLNDVADQRLRFQNEKVANRFRDEDALEETRLLAMVHELEASRN